MPGRRDCDGALWLFDDQQRVHSECSSREAALSFLAEISLVVSELDGPALIRCARMHVKWRSLDAFSMKPV